MNRIASAALLALSLLSPVLQLDVATRDAVRAIRSPGLDRAAQVVSDAGRPPVVLGALLLIAILDNTAGVLTARRALLALLPTNLVVEVVKRSVGRERPDGERKPSNAAFPSSHAANAAALAVVLAARWRKLTPVFVTLAVAVCAARVLLERHWLTDVLIGALIGTAAGVLACQWPRRANAQPPRGARKEVESAASSGVLRHK